MFVSHADNRWGCWRAISWAAVSLALQIGLIGAVIQWGVPWFGPLIVPASVLALASIAVAYFAWREARRGKAYAISLEPDALVLNGVSYGLDTVSLEVRPWVAVLLRRDAAQEPAAAILSPLAALYLSKGRLDSMVTDFQRADIPVLDQRKSVRMAFAIAYGITVVGTAAFVIWKLLIYSGFALVHWISTLLGHRLGLPSVLVFFAIAVAAAWGLVLTRRRRRPSASGAKPGAVSPS